MIVLSINMGGSGCVYKRQSLRRILQNNKVSFVAIQESKMASSDLFRLKSIWGNYNFEYVESLSEGRSGGLVSIWDPNCFVKVDHQVFDNFIVVKCKWVVNDCVCYMVNVYAPQSERERVDLWNKILSVMNVSDGCYLLCGDFNSVRARDERMGSVFSISNASNFNDFIDRGRLIDVALGRHRFTRMSSDGLKASRLDRFLVSQEFVDLNKDYVLEALDDLISDHRPLLFKQHKMDFGPIPFKFYNSWLNVDGFDGVFKESWGKVGTNFSDNAFVSFKNKLKTLKLDLKAWRHVGRNTLINQ